MKLDLEILQFCCCLIANFGTELSASTSFALPSAARPPPSPAPSPPPPPRSCRPRPCRAGWPAGRGPCQSSKYRVTMVLAGWVDLDFGSSRRHVDSCYSYLLPKGKSTQPKCATTMVTSFRTKVSGYFSSHL